jgi:hypothetical protein
MRPLVGPFTQPGWRKRIAANILPPMMASISGEINQISGEYYTPIGVARFAGEINDVNLSVVSCGRDNTNPLSIEARVYINHVEALSTYPKLTFVSGEAPGHKTTFSAASSGVQKAVVDRDNSKFDAGDIISVSFVPVRTPTPTNEISSPCVVVELEPEM